MPKQSLHIRSDREATVLAWMTRPSWAEVLDQDGYGLYADLKLQGITQRFRWIPPGVFMMGSPESEPGRSSYETQHEVTFRQGYWFADTACSQALWLAVMGENPSTFNEDLNNPVETVNWDDCQQFIKHLNGIIPDLAARLPTEAEWEYACRAGTTTPFSFGDNITTEQVNYNGNYPYNNGKKGEYRQKTVAVKSLSANPWGLYEMHGNVLEWCADWFGDYPTTAVENPTGPTADTAGVVRGGSWDDGGGGVRSADRSRGTPDYRYDDLGFRLALGHSGAASQADGRRAVAGQTAAR
ncbi:MAG: formylglycine-generating enzyme family protein [Methylococcaceae bacterium]|nr:formylglycine-generating enzyme family protein [Methylococcaceae bacterium]